MPQVWVCTDNTVDSVDSVDNDECVDNNLMIVDDIF